MPQAATVSAIIPVRGNFSLTRDCLTSLARTGTDGLEIIVVDNGSEDMTPRQLPELGAALFGSSFRYIRFEENRNFAPACNAGAKAARGDFVFFLNNDTIAREGWLGPLLREFAKDSRLGAAGPLLTYADQSVQHLGVTILPGGTLSHLYRSLPASHPLARKKRFFQILTGAALLMPRALFLASGCFDEGFVNGFEDVDLCLRLGSRGHKLLSVPQSEIVHLESKTPNRFGHERENSRRLLGKWRLETMADLPDLVEADGVGLAIMPELEPRLMARPEVSAALISRLKPFDPRVCLQLLEDEPFWEEGYDILGQYLEKAGEAGAALELYGRAINRKNSCSFKDYARMERVQRALGLDTQALETARSDLLKLCADENQARRLKRILHSLAEGSPAKRALIPDYERAYAEGLALSASAEKA